MKTRFMYLTAMVAVAMAQPVRAQTVVSPQRLSDADVLRTYIVGDFDNRPQINRDRADGAPLHPYSRFVNRLADDKVRNRPAGQTGFYVLEERYYVYPGQDTLVKPQLYFLETTASGAVKLHVLQWPDTKAAKQIRNDNPGLQFDYNTLTEMPGVPPTPFVRTYRGFYLNTHPTATVPAAGQLLLERTIGRDFLEVTEAVNQSGKRATLYSAPIIYKRL